MDQETNPATVETLLIRCASCEAMTHAAIEGGYRRYSDEAGYSVRWSLLCCPACDSPTLVSQDNHDAMFIDDVSVNEWGSQTYLYPEPQRRLGASVPGPIRRAFDEARSCFSEAKAYTACAIMCRKVLEGICASSGVEKGTLATRLKALADSGDLDKRIYEWINEMRLVGNEAAHDVNITVSREDAEDLLDLAEAIAENLYTLREKFDNFKKRRVSDKLA